MSDHVAFLRAIAADPADDTARLAYADFLEESGGEPDRARAEFVRTQVRAHTLHVNDPRRGELETRAAELFAEHWVGWWAGVCSGVGLPPPPPPPAGFRKRLRRFFGQPDVAPGHPYQTTGAVTVGRVTQDTFRGAAFERGFPQWVSFLGGLAEAGEVVRRWTDASPLVELALHGVLAADWRAIDGRHLHGVRRLAFVHTGAWVVAAAGESPHLTRLEELTLRPDRSNVLWPVGQYREFAASPLAGRVRKLRVVIGGADEAAALDGPHLANLRGLHAEVEFTTGEPLEDIQTSRAVADLLGSGHLTGLEELTLRGAAAPALDALPLPAAAGLRRLTVLAGQFQQANLTRLLASDALAALTDLTISTHQFAEAGLALADSPLAGRLRHLRLTGVPMAELRVTTSRLARALDPDRLETLAVDRHVREVPEVWAELLGLFPDRVSVV